MSAEPENEELSSELPPPTMPLNLNFGYQGFTSEDDAHKCHAVLLQVISTISSYLNLERLDGVTVAYDYAGALANLDRGFKASAPLTPSTELAVGIAMAPVVLRDGIVKAHLVLNVAYIEALGDPKHEHWKLAFYTVAHECGHVHDLRARDLAFPNVLLKVKFQDLDEALRYQTSSACWEEYAACRMSAGFRPEHIELYEQTFVEVLDVAQKRANGRIYEYLTHKNHQRLVTEVSEEYRNLMKFASYVLGHMAGADLAMSSIPKTEAKLKGHWFEPYFNELRSALEVLWERYGQWTGLKEFEPIAQIGMTLMVKNGVDLRRAPNGELFLLVDESKAEKAEPASAGKVGGK